MLYFIYRVLPRYTANLDIMPIRGETDFEPIYYIIFAIFNAIRTLNLIITINININNNFKFSSMIQLQGPVAPIK